MLNYVYSNSMSQHGSIFRVTNVVLINVSAYGSNSSKVYVGGVEVSGSNYVYLLW